MAINEDKYIDLIERVCAERADPENHTTIEKHLDQIGEELQKGKFGLTDEQWARFRGLINQSHHRGDMKNYCMWVWGHIKGEITGNKWAEEEKARVEKAKKEEEDEAAKVEKALADAKALAEENEKLKKQIAALEKKSKK